MKNKLLKKSMAILMTLAMVIGLLPAMTITASAEDKTETFESCNFGATSFSSNKFIIEPAVSFQVNEFSGYGYSGDKFIDNSQDKTSCSTFKIKSLNWFCIKSLYLYPSNDGGRTNQKTEVDVTFTGKRLGTTVFTYKPDSNLFASADSSNSTNKGFSLVDFSVPGYNRAMIDELVISLGEKTKYFAIDDFTWNTDAPFAPSVVTQAASAISSTTATGNGNITNFGSFAPTAYGVCWNTTGTPTISDSKVTNGTASATGAFTANMTGLTAGTKYYVRAYATNTENTSYGNEESFTTAAAGNDSPKFIGASALTVDANSSETDIKSLLHVSDTDIGQTLTWTLAPHQATVH